jgi:hypothetical protein
MDGKAENSIAILSRMQRFWDRNVSKLGQNSGRWTKFNYSTQWGESTPKIPPKNLNPKNSQKVK